MTAQTAGTPWGAAPPDWAHFADHLGLRADLLPVVSNPDARISPDSKMRDLGKTPSRYNNAGLVVGLPAWTRIQASEREVGRWLANSDIGICLQTRTVRAIDIDIADPVRAAAVREFVEMGAGTLPVRSRANSGKCLLTFSMPGDFAKRVIRCADGIIEFLATGQQFIAVGTHPSGARYEWEGGLPGRIPALTPAEFEVLWQALVAQFALPGGDHRERKGMVPSVPRVASATTDPTVAWLDENGWVTGYERDGRVDVRCPWEGEHTSDSGPSSTSYFPAGVGGFAQGHFRCLHAHCSGRSDGDFLAEVGYVTSDFEVVEAVSNAKGEPERALPPFVRDRHGAPLATLNNILMAVRRPDVCGYRVGYDTFLDHLMMAPDSTVGGGAWERFHDNAYTSMRSELERRGFLPVSAEMIKDVVKLVAYERRFDSAVDWAGTLAWDGVERVATFYSDRFGVPANDYTRAVANYTWTALAARCLEAGAKCDMVPVFVGLQAAGKTSVVESMSPLDEAFVEVNLERKDDDLARSLRGKLVGEIAELRGLQTRDAEAIKAWVSRRWEEWTPKYKEFGTRFGRRLVLFGTSNRDDILDDETGERRWLPMRVGAVDVAGVRADRDQLWAEGIEMFKRSGVAWQDAFRLAPLEHAQFKVGDPWADPISEWLGRDDLDGPRSLVRTIDVLVGACGLDMARIGRRDELRVAKVLRMLGLEKIDARVEGRVMKVWRRAEKRTFAVSAEKRAFDDLA